jgi:hypothetical protein
MIRSLYWMFYFKEEIVKSLFILGIILGLGSTLAAVEAGAQTSDSQTNSSTGLGQPVPAPAMTPDQQMDFEDTHLIMAETGLFDIRYTLNGQVIGSEQELKNIIASADDEEALQDLKDAENRSSISWVFIGGGSGMLVVGALASWNNNNTLLFNVLAIGGLATDLVGGIFYRTAQSEQLDAVDRYNQVIRQDNGLSLLPLQSAPLGLAYVQRF